MKRLLALALTVLGLAGVAGYVSQAQTNVDRNPLPYTIGKVTLTRPQQVLGSKQSLRGLSAEESKLLPSAAVTGGVAFITTPSWPDGPLDIGPVELITIDGNQTIDHGPEDVDNQSPDWPGNEDAAVADGVKIGTAHPRVRFAKILNWRGTAVYATFAAGSAGNRSIKVEHNLIRKAFTGINVVADTEVIGNTIIACRDYGLTNPNGAGNVTLMGNHWFGCNGETTTGVYDGICVYMQSASGWRIVGNAMADSHYGFVASGGGSHTTTLTGNTFFKNSICALQFRSGATNFIVDGCTINVPPGTSDAAFDDIMGIELQAGVQRIFISNCTICLDGVQAAGLPGTPLAGRSTAVYVAADGMSLSNVLLQDFGHPAGKATGIHIPSQIDGFKADFRVWGFEAGAGDVLLDIDVNTIKGCDITIRGNSEDSDSFPSDVDATAAANYVDIPSGWDSTNSIRLINEANGDVFPLVTGTAY